VRIIFRHILPNARPVLVSASFGIMDPYRESTLSFLAWRAARQGVALSRSATITSRNRWMVVFPGVALFTTVTCFNLVEKNPRRRPR
jgi:peptide/nickel transport system permease protein